MVSTLKDARKRVFRPLGQLCADPKNISFLVNSHGKDQLASCGLFAWLISHQPAVLFSQNKPATSNQPAVLLSEQISTSHQPPAKRTGWWFDPYRKLDICGTTWTVQGSAYFIDKMEMCADRLIGLVTI
jgi:hypothetical protein